MQRRFCASFPRPSGVSRKDAARTDVTRGEVLRGEAADVNVVADALHEIAVSEIDADVRRAGLIGFEENEISGQRFARDLSEIVKLNVRCSRNGNPERC